MQGGDVGILWQTAAKGSKHPTVCLFQLMTAIPFTITSLLPELGWVSFARSFAWPNSVSHYSLHETVPNVALLSLVFLGVSVLHVWVARLELTTSWSQIKHSTKLNYTQIRREDRNRTCTLQIRSLLPYPLGYFPLKEIMGWDFIPHPT